MAWGNTLSRTTEQKLNQIKDWRSKGLAYWQGRVAKCDAMWRNREKSFANRERAYDQKQIAEEAVRRLREDAVAA